MKIAFPTRDDQGLESPVYGHFGSADFFIIAETGSDTVETVANKDRGHHPGQCQPLSALGRLDVDAVAVGGIGGGALFKLQAAGIKIYRAVEGTVRENLALIEAGRLPEFTADQTCAGHDAKVECVH